jgi:hypothetical protein
MISFFLNLNLLEVITHMPRCVLKLFVSISFFCAIAYGFFLFFLCALLHFFFIIITNDLLLFLCLLCMAY